MKRSTQEHQTTREGKDIEHNRTTVISKDGDIKKKKNKKYIPDESKEQLRKEYSDELIGSATNTDIGGTLKDEESGLKKILRSRKSSGGPVPTTSSFSSLTKKIIESREAVVANDEMATTATAPVITFSSSLPPPVYRRKAHPMYRRPKPSVVGTTNELVEVKRYSSQSHSTTLSSSTKEKVVIIKEDTVLGNPKIKFISIEADVPVSVTLPPLDPDHSRTIEIRSIKNLGHRIIPTHQDSINDKKAPVRLESSGTIKFVSHENNWMTF